MSRLAVILYQPDIPQNTGNIIRLCANSGVELHLVKPLGWGNMNDSKLRRAGLDYHEYANLVIHDNWAYCRDYFGQRPIWAVETCGLNYCHQVNYAADAVFLFGSETRGLPPAVLDQIQAENVIRLPMLPKQRSLNLANSVAIVVYEAWRQLGFAGGV